MTTGPALVEVSRRQTTRDAMLPGGTAIACVYSADINYCKNNYRKNRSPGGGDFRRARAPSLAYRSPLWL
jgi:hypothetical protein